MYGDQDEHVIIGVVQLDIAISGTMERNVIEYTNHLHEQW